MPDTFALTILFIALSTFVAAFVKGRSKDKCLRAFKNDRVTVYDTVGKKIWGKLRVENTGLELIYKDIHHDSDGHIETSCILYKHELGNIQALVRFHDELDEKNTRDREKELKKTYHPGLISRLSRKTMNIFRTIRDSFAEVINVFLSQVKKAPSGTVIASQDKYVNQMKSELIGSVGTAYEPLLERYIGRKVVLEMIRQNDVVEYPGVLKDYTADWIEILDVFYKADNDSQARKADILVPRKLGIIRHHAE